MHVVLNEKAFSYKFFHWHKFKFYINQELRYQTQQLIFVIVL